MALDNYDYTMAELEFIRNGLGLDDLESQIDEVTAEYQAALTAYFENPEGMSTAEMTFWGQRMTKLARKSLDTVSTVIAWDSAITTINEKGVAGLNEFPKAGANLKYLSTAFKSFEVVMTFTRAFDKISSGETQSAEDWKSLIFLLAGGAISFSEVSMVGIKAALDQIPAGSATREAFETALDEITENYNRYSQAAQKAANVGDWAEVSKQAALAEDTLQQGMQRISGMADDVVEPAFKSAAKKFLGAFSIGLDIAQAGIGIAKTYDDFNKAFADNEITGAEAIALAARLVGLMGDLAGAASDFTAAYPTLYGALKAVEIGSAITSTLLFIAAGAQDAVEEKAANGIESDIFFEIGMSLAALKDTLWEGGENADKFLTTDHPVSFLSDVAEFVFDAGFDHLFGLGQDSVKATRILEYQNELKNYVSVLAQSVGVKEWQYFTAFGDHYIETTGFDNQTVFGTLSYTFDHEISGKGIIWTDASRFDPSNNEMVTGTDGGDFIIVANFDQGTVLYAGEGNDRVIAGEVFSEISAHDMLDGAARAGIHLDGGEGFDVVDLTQFGAQYFRAMTAAEDRTEHLNRNQMIEVDLDEGSAVVQVDPYDRESTVEIENLFSGFEGVRGTDSDEVFRGVLFANAGGGDDKVYSSASGSVVYGDGGNDSLYGGAGADNLHGGDGTDRLRGGAGDDELAAGGGVRDYLFGEDGNDRLIIGMEKDPSFGSYWQKNVNGGDGFDVLVADADNTGLVHRSSLTFEDGQAYTPVLHAHEIEAIEISDASQGVEGGRVELNFTAEDRASGNFSGLRAMATGSGNDTIKVRDADHIDSLTIASGGGSDLIDFQGEDMSLEVLLAGENSTVFGSDGGNFMDARVVENTAILHGGAGADLLVANGGAQTALHGAHGDDVLVSGQSGASTTTLEGGQGKDIFAIRPNANYNQRYGEQGLLAAGTHVAIADFTKGQDRIDVSEITRDFVEQSGLSFDEVFDRSVEITTLQDVTYVSVSAVDDNGEELRATFSVQGSSSDLSLSSSDFIFDARHGDDFLYQRKFLTNDYAKDALAFAREELGIDENGDLITFEVHGTNGNDVIKGDRRHEIISGEKGHDVISTGGGLDTVYGDDGNDKISGGSRANWLEGGRHNDTINAGDGDDTIYTGSEDRDGVESYGKDLARGGNGNDLIVGSNGVDRLYGQFGNDTLKGGDDWLTADRDHLYGGKGDDLLIATQSDVYASHQEYGDELFGELGNDTLQGGQADDKLSGGYDDDLIWGGTGNDKIYTGDISRDGYRSFGNDTAHGGDGNDLVVGSNGGDTLYGDAGNDTLRGGDEGKKAVGDALYGGDGDDILISGQGFVDAKYVENGDLLSGGAGDDQLIGGDANDTLEGGSGLDTLDGGLGLDIARLDGALTDYRLRAYSDTPAQGDLVTLTNTKTNETTDIQNVEMFQFSDGAFLTYDWLLDARQAVVDVKGLADVPLSVSASSISSITHYAELAIDGNYQDGQFYQSHASDRDPFLELDLGSTFSIERLELVVGPYQAIDDLSDATVTLLNEYQNVVAQFDLGASSGSLNPVSVVTENGYDKTLLDVDTTQARYIRIEKEGYNQLNLAELDVFVEDTFEFTDPSVHDIGVTASSEANSQRDASNLIDGDTSTGDYFRSHKSDKSPWVEFDLNDEFVLRRIDITHDAATGGNLNGAELVLLSETGAEIERFDPILHAQNLDEISFVIGDDVNPVRYVRLENDGRELKLSELDIFGEHNDMLLGWG